MKKKKKKISQKLTRQIRGENHHSRSIHHASQMKLHYRRHLLQPLLSFHLDLHLLTMLLYHLSACASRLRYISIQFDIMLRIVHKCLWFGYTQVESISVSCCHGLILI